MGRRRQRTDQLRVTNFPDESALYGNVLGNITPLDRFFWCGGLGHYIDGRMNVAIDPKKVYVSPHDANVLYSIHRDFMVLIHGEIGQEIAVEQWLRLGPAVIPKLPKGIVAMEDGYLSIV